MQRMSSLAETVESAPLRLGDDDAGEILTLQRAAYVTEAQLYRDVDLPPLTQSLVDLAAELARPEVTVWGYRDGGRLVAAMRIRTEGDVAHLGRVVVAPDLQGRGLGSALLSWVEHLLPEEVSAVELFTGEHSTANLRLYTRLGYRETMRTPVGEYSIVHLRKPVRAAPGENSGASR